jgi:hypothetical protein
MANLLQRQDLAKPWKDHRLTVCLPHLETPELLLATVRLWQLQWEVPFILVMDTGSISSRSREALASLESQPGIEVSRLGIHSAVEHTSDRVAIAMDYAFSRCPTECLLGTHIDVFPKHRDLVDKFLSYCGEATPVVGWEMSPRGDGAAGLISGTLANGIPGHAFTIYHMPTMDRIGAGWSIRRAHHAFGLPRGHTRTPGWPDTEVCLGRILAAHGITPLFLGRETNADIQETEDWLHARSSTTKILIQGRLRDGQIREYQSALARIRKWEAEGPSSRPSDWSNRAWPPPQPSAFRTEKRDLSPKQAFCHSQHELVPGENAYFCSHPAVGAMNNIVTREICQICELRHGPPPSHRRSSPAFVTPSSDFGAVKTVAVVIQSCADVAFEDTLASALNQSRAPDEVLILADPSAASMPKLDGRFTGTLARIVSLETSNVLDVHRAALHETRADVLCLLTGGSRLGPDYLRKGLEAFSDPRVGIVYSDVQHVADAETRAYYPESCNRSLLARRCVIHGASLVRRPALAGAVSGAVRAPDACTAPLSARHPVSGRLSRDHENRVGTWRLWRAVMSDGWHARKQDALLECADGNEPDLAGDPRPSGRHDFFVRAGLGAEQITLLIPLTSRDCWPSLAKFLSRQTWPHDQLSLVLASTCDDSRLERRVHDWLVDCDYPDVRIVSSGMKELDAGVATRRSFMSGAHAARAQAVTRLIRDTASDFVWLLDDDLIPDDDICDRLLHRFDEDTACVTAAICLPSGRASIAWQRSSDILLGPGLGCSLLRGEFARDSIFLAPSSAESATVVASKATWNGYLRISTAGLNVRLDWSARIAHALACREGQSE